jgi:hypothetical protein
VSEAKEISDSLSDWNFDWKYGASKISKYSSIVWIFVSAFNKNECAEIAEALFVGAQKIFSDSKLAKSAPGFSEEKTVRPFTEKASAISRESGNSFPMINKFDLLHYIILWNCILVYGIMQLWKYG